jgi:hypothetical protein
MHFSPASSFHIGQCGAIIPRLIMMDNEAPLPVVL